MERISLLRFPITQREINSNSQVDLAPAEDVFQESVLLLDLGVIEDELAVLALHDWDLHVLQILSQVMDVEQDTSDVLVSAILRRDEELEFDVAVLVAGAHIMFHKYHLVELKEELRSTV